MYTTQVGISIPKSPQVIGTLIIGVAVVVTSVIISFSKSNNAGAQKTTEPSPQKTEDITDTDSDGVPDWEEQLYGTDIHKSDTNDDGVSDQDEIAAKKKDSARNDGSGSDSGGQPITKTEALANDLVGTYIARNELGVYKQDDNSKIISNALERTKKLIYTLYTADTLKKTTKDTSDERAARYRAETKTILEPMFAIPEYELQTYARAVDKNDPVEFGKIQEYAKIYADVADKLMTVETPLDAVNQHIALANALSYLSASLNGMSKGYDDVAGSYAAVGHFGKAEQEVEQAFHSFETYFLIKHVENI